MNSRRRYRRLDIFFALSGDALGNLRMRPSRSLLALMGIGVGTAAVIAMLHVGTNARAAAMRQFDAVGADFVTIQPQPGTGSVRAMERADVEALSSRDTGIAQAAPAVLGTGTLIEGREQIQGMVIATTAELRSLLRLKLASGRFVSDMDGATTFAVIGAGIASRIEVLEHRSVSIGDRLRLGDVVLTVVGVLQPQPMNPLIGVAFDDAVIVPFRAAPRFVPFASISTVMARMQPEADQNAMKEAVAKFFSKRLRGGGVQIQVATALIDSIDAQMKIYSNLLAAIGAVSLAMGGIGIMNVMLMSVMERQGEIGLRAAVGASPSAIMTMFLLESTALSVIGSAGGIVCGVLAGWVFAARSGWPFQIAPASFPLGGGMALTSGLVFGLYPAWRAASLQPIEALRRG